MTSDWAPLDPADDVHPASAYCAQRRRRVFDQLGGRTLVVATGGLKVRSHDTDYRFRPGTDFFYLTGCSEPDAVLVIAPGADGPRSTLYVPERRDHRTHEFYTDSRYGELWVGARRGTREAASYYQIDTAPLEHLAKDLSSLTAPLVVRGFDASLDALVAAQRDDHLLAEALSEMRLTKDEFEVAQLQLAVDHTVKGFEDVVRALSSAVGRGERVIEGIFNLRARVEGNDVGYDTIAASGSNATVLHWTSNTGPVREGDLVLLDAGVECDNLYTADVTRTMPVNGRFSPAQRRIYELVLAAQSAGIAAIKPGVAFHAAHDAAVRILAEGLHELGILADEPDVALRRERQTHRRYTLHGVSHMLGIDVHDCANARNDVYLGELHEGYVLTVEPGLYFQPNDLTVPVTATGARNLSAALPRAADDVEAWMADLWSRGSTDLGF